MAYGQIPKGKNKRIICFIDETGTAGDENFSLGLVMAFAKDVSKIDKQFSDLMPAGFNEFHANKHENDFVFTAINSLRDNASETSLMMFSHFHRVNSEITCRETIYASVLIEAVKASSKKFRTNHKLGSFINNIEVYIDMSEHNTGPIFNKIIKEALNSDGIFRGVNRVVPIDSSISRLIQLADAVAYMRHLAMIREIKLQDLDKQLGITVF